MGRKYERWTSFITSLLGMGEEVAHRVLEGIKVWGTMPKLWKENMVSRVVKRELYEKEAIPTMVYGS